jgi:hypothetical protein
MLSFLPIVLDEVLRCLHSAVLAVLMKNIQLSVEGLLEIQYY